jgi:signal transduction histidine kinase
MALNQSIDDILLVEDNPGDAKLLELTFRDESFTGVAGPDDITHVETLADGLAELAETDYDVVFLDLGLPESTGLDTLDRVMEDDPATPVIVLTGLDDQERAIQAIQRGAQDYLVKGDITGNTVARSLRYAIERRKQTVELERKKEQMEFFNSILRHDLLNGMNVIKMRAELLETRLDGDDRAEAETIVRWSDNIIDLTEKVRATLDTLTAESDPELQPIAMGPVVERQAERVRGKADGVTVRTDVPDDARVLADDLLGDVLGNVLTNAVEHGSTSPHSQPREDAVEHGHVDGVEIDVRVEAGDHETRIIVADDGPGFPVDQRERVFERGETGTQSTGTGFGLYFVGAMVDTYGGTVEIGDSDAGGAEVTIELTTA